MHTNHIIDGPNYLNTLFKISASKPENIIDRECSITILDIHAEDNGAWTCHVKKDLRSVIFSEAFVNVEVATPYGLSVDIPSQLKFTPLTDTTMPDSEEEDGHSDVLESVIIKTNSTNKYASCSASSMDSHGGGVDPKLTWFVNGKQLHNTNSEMLQKLVNP